MNSYTLVPVASPVWEHGGRHVLARSYVAATTDAIGRIYLSLAIALNALPGFLDIHLHLNRFISARLGLPCIFRGFN